MVLLYGIHPVAECIKAGRRRVRSLWVSDGRRLRQLETAAGVTMPCDVRIVAGLECTRRAGSPHHQGVVAEVDAYPYVDWHELLESGAGAPPFILALDGLTDPHNVGAILRSAFCAGVTGVTLRNHHAALITATVAKISVGACEHLRVALVSNQAMFLRAAGDSGAVRISLEAGGEAFWDAEVAWKEPLVLVVGEEGKGVSRLVGEHCDRKLGIPMRGGLDSLNASVAASLVMFEAALGRRAAGGRSPLSGRGIHNGDDQWNTTP